MTEKLYENISKHEKPVYVVDFEGLDCWIENFVERKVVIEVEKLTNVNRIETKSIKITLK